MSNSFRNFTCSNLLHPLRRNENVRVMLWVSGEDEKISALTYRYQGSRKLLWPNQVTKREWTPYLMHCRLLPSHQTTHNHILANLKVALLFDLTLTVRVTQRKHNKNVTQGIESKPINCNGYLEHFSHSARCYWRTWNWTVRDKQWNEIQRVAKFLIICITVYVFVPDTSWKKIPTCFIAIRWVCFHGRILIVGKTGTKIVFFKQKVTFVHVMSLRFQFKHLFSFTNSISIDFMHS